MKRAGAISVNLPLSLVVNLLSPKGLLVADSTMR